MLPPWIAARALVAVGYIAAVAIANRLLLPPSRAVPQRTGRPGTAPGTATSPPAATTGYPLQGVRFFPLFPLIGRVLAAPFGGRVELGPGRRGQRRLVGGGGAPAPVGAARAVRPTPGRAGGLVQRVVPGRVRPRARLRRGDHVRGDDRAFICLRRRRWWWAAALGWPPRCRARSVPRSPCPRSSRRSAGSDRCRDASGSGGSRPSSRRSPDSWPTWPGSITCSATGGCPSRCRTRSVAVSCCRRRASSRGSARCSARSGSTTACTSRSC